MAGIAVVFRRTLVDLAVTTFLTDQAAEDAMNAFADQMTAVYRQQHPDDPEGEYGERRAHPDGGRFCMMCADAPDFPGSGAYPAPPRGVLFLEQGPAPIEWVGEDWDGDPP